MGFFTNVAYTQDLESTNRNFFEKAEQVAFVLRSPTRWVANDLFGKSHLVKIMIDQNEISTFNALPTLSNDSFRRGLRIASGLALCVFGELLALPCMGAAYLSEEIRLKHRFAVNALTNEQKERLKQLIADRQTLDQQRQGCEPISCLLTSICCLLFCLVCCPRK